VRPITLVLLALAACFVACSGDEATPPVTITASPSATATASPTATTSPTGTASPTPVEAVHVFGTLLIDDVPAPEGARLEVVGGAGLCAEGTVTALGGQATYSLMVPETCPAPWALRVNGFEVGSLDNQPGRQDLVFALATSTPTASPTATATVTATPTATATTDPDDYTAAIEREIEARDFDPTGAPAAVELGPGEFFIAHRAICVDSVDGACQSVFFFVNDRFVATDADNPWFGIADPEATAAGEILLSYVNYLPEDPLCCPSGEPIEITFTWDGSSLVSSAIPPGDQQHGTMPETYFPAIQADVESRGFTPAGEPLVETLADGTYFIAQDAICTGSATGYCANIFFYVNDVFVAADTDEANYGTLDLYGNGNGTFTAEYPVYFTGDPNCCPSGEPAPITFSYDGSSLVLSAVPPPLP